MKLRTLSAAILALGITAACSNVDSAAPVQKQADNCFSRIEVTAGPIQAPNPMSPPARLLAPGQHPTPSLSARKRSTEESG